MAGGQSAAEREQPEIVCFQRQQDQHVQGGLDGEQLCSLLEEGPARAVPPAAQAWEAQQGRQRETTQALPGPRLHRRARRETGPWPVPSQAGIAQITAPVAARTADPVPLGESRSRRAVKLAFLVLLVGDELAMHITPEASLGCLARSKDCSVLGKVGAVVLRKGGVWAVHWALRTLTLASRAMGVRVTRGGEAGTGAGGVGA